LGLGLAIGYEAMPLVVPTLGLAAVMAVWHPLKCAGMMRAAAAATAVLFVTFFLTIRPGRWLDVRCDALSLNLVVLAIFATAGFWAAISASPNRAVRFAILGGFLVVGGAAYASLEPACLTGPYGQLNPALRPILLDRVFETKSVFSLSGNEP